MATTGRIGCGAGFARESLVPEGNFPLKAIPATYESTCSLCDGRIYEEDEIVCLDDEWVHAICAEDEGEQVAR